MHSAEIETYAVAPGQSLVASSEKESRKVFIRDFRSGQEKGVLERPDPVTTLAWNRSGDLLAVAHNDASVSLLKWPGGDEVSQLKIPKEVMKLYEKPLKKISLVRISPNASTLAVICGQGELMSWILKEDSAKVNIHHVSRFWDALFSPDGGHLAAVGSTFSLEMHADGRNLQFSSINSMLWVGEVGSDRTWKVTSTNDIYEKVFWTSSGNEILVYATRPSPDGDTPKLLLVFLKESLMRGSSSSMAELKIGKGGLLAAGSFNADESQFFANLEDNRIHVFDLEFRNRE